MASAQDDDDDIHYKINVNGTSHQPTSIYTPASGRGLLRKDKSAAHQSIASSSSGKQHHQVNPI